MQLKNVTFVYKTCTRIKISNTAEENLGDKEVRGIKYVY